CLAAIGKNGGEQLLSLGQGCDSVSIAAHEIGHALGLYHTMSRHDRDQFIIVDMANVEPYYRNQLLHHNYAQTFGLPYDYGSIMHYSGSSVSINKMQPAMMAFDLDHQQTLGSPFVSFIDLSMINELYGCKSMFIDSVSINKMQPAMMAFDLDHQQTLGSPFVSFIDLSMINELYGCKSSPQTLCRPAPYSVACGMYGFPNPRDCRKCICPGGYGGDRCTERPKGNCGSTIGASPYWNILRVVMGDVNVRQPLEDFTVCNYWITHLEYFDQFPQRPHLFSHLISGLPVKQRADVLTTQAVHIYVILC
ncbi:astacin, partial [Ostertagia ostertagi]